MEMGEVCVAMASATDASDGADSASDLGVCLDRVCVMWLIGLVSHVSVNNFIWGLTCHTQ